MHTVAAARLAEWHAVVHGVRKKVGAGERVSCAKADFMACGTQDMLKLIAGENAWHRSTK
jgi:hypothetical protein